MSPLTEEPVGKTLEGPSGLQFSTRLGLYVFSLLSYGLGPIVVVMLLLYALYLAVMLLA